MRLTQLAIMAIRGSDSGIQKLADALAVAPSSVYRYLNTNSDDLTKAAALIVIREVTGLNDDMILESVPVSTQ